MKKFFAIFAAACALLVVSCTKPADKKDEAKVDLTELNALVAECEALANAATTESYTQASIDAFKKAIADVKAAAASATSQAVVTSLITRLTEAKKTFEESAVDAIPAEAVTFALSFDEGTGTELKTTGKYQWTAKLEKGAEELFPDTKLPEFVDGKVGKALHFADASHLSIADYVPAALGGKAISISCWVKPDELRASNYIVSYQSWHVWKFQTQDGGKPFFTLATDKGITDMDNETDGSVEVGKWAHLVVSWGNETGDINMYVNGQLTKTWEGTAHDGRHGKGAVIRDPEEAAILELAIGSDETINMKRGTDNAQVSAWDAWFHGAIDELAVYNIALSQGQVTKLYNSQK
ncbi:MAG: LamG domain-containing protein [Bacteroidales bacterium]|nr:LamG domain-containing protein [Bacteroidales bacterium]